MNLQVLDQLLDVTLLKHIDVLVHFDEHGLSQFHSFGKLQDLCCSFEQGHNVGFIVDEGPWFVWSLCQQAAQVVDVKVGDLCLPLHH